MVGFTDLGSVNRDIELLIAGADADSAEDIPQMRLAQHAFVFMVIHSLAQTIGYYSAYEVSMPPPVVAVITATDISFVSPIFTR